MHMPTWIYFNVHFQQVNIWWLTGNQYTSCCSTSDCTSAGHVAEPEYAEVDYFQLRSEDVDLVGTNQLLQNALVKSDQIQITGDLGEGMFGVVVAH